MVAEVVCGGLLFLANVMNPSSLHMQACESRVKPHCSLRSASIPLLAAFQLNGRPARDPSGTSCRRCLW
jgi:hypothetical protein